MRMRDKIKEQQERIDYLEVCIKKYYNAIFELKGSVDRDFQNTIRGMASLYSREQKPVILVPDSIKREILRLPLLDCGIK